MAFSSKSKVMAFVEEVTEGVVIDPAAEDFVIPREGSQLTGAVETIESDELRNSIGASKSFVSKQAPTGSVNRYHKASGVEGQAPEDAILYKSAFGDLAVKSVEVATTTGSTAGDKTTRGQLHLADGDVAAGSLEVGQAVLIKDGTNGYKVRAIQAIDASGAPDLVDLNFNTNQAVPAGVDLGLAVFFRTIDEGHPTFSAHEYQSSTDASAYHKAEGGCRTQSVALEYPANDLATASFEIAGIKFGENPVELTATNKYIDFTDNVGTVQAIMDEGFYATPIDLANAIAAKMTAASAPSEAAAISCEFDKVQGKFIISTDGALLSLLWNTGAQTANSIALTIGFDNAADDTGALTYTADEVLKYGPPAVPSYDASEPTIVRNNELLLGSFSDSICFSGQQFSISIETPKTDIPDWCPESGVSESVVLSRTVPLSGTLKFKKHDAERTYKLLNNETISLQFTTGKKVAGNWVPGTVTTVWVPEASITTSNKVDQDGYIVEAFEGNAIVGTQGLQDVYYSQL